MIEPMTALRPLTDADIALFVAWEKCERPYPWADIHFRETMSSATQKTLVWSSATHVYGFGVVQLVRDQSYLLNIMINPDLRRQGFGRSLLQKILMWAKGAGAEVMDLDVDGRNSAAIELYRSAGFVEIGQRKAAYPNGETALQMRTYLTP